MRIALPFVFAATLGAQESMHPGRTGARRTLPQAEEIALARSAAPVSVSDSASVYVFTDSVYVLARQGSSGAACYVSRSWPASLEPHCFDREGAATIMLLHMREVELLHRGLSPQQAAREVGSAIMQGKLRLPSRPVMSYMMSAEQSLISDTGQPAGRWRPHVMIYYPFLAAPAQAPDVQAGIITGAGTPTSSIMIVVPEFVTVRRTTSFK